MSRPKALPSLAEGRPSAQSVDEWVGGAHPSETDHSLSTTQIEEPLKRLTLDIPASLHSAIKTDCARRGLKMIEDIRPLLEAHYLGRQTEER